MTMSATTPPSLSSSKEIGVIFIQRSRSCPLNKSQSLSLPSSQMEVTTSALCGMDSLPDQKPAICIDVFQKRLQKAIRACWQSNSSLEKNYRQHHEVLFVSMTVIQMGIVYMQGSLLSAYLLILLDGSRTLLIFNTSSVISA